ncbi:MAG TPA: DNA polymerase III subunit delta' [Tepidisphaeraceae bacterium]|nr:DNA polymerase III subunit delta' [Tepidisphaeraceae bacterium]
MIRFDDILGQSAAVEFLRAACLADRLPHAMIFAGSVGVGKRTCATALAGWFLCPNARGDKACGKCDSCRLIPTGNHPDLHIVAKELIRFHDKTGKSKGINLSIDVVRPELIEPAARTAAMGHGKFFIIEQADLMSDAAQNALLKTLEEPAGRTAIVLLTDAPESLLPTVRSRCQIVRFASLDTKAVQARLEKQGIDSATAADAAELSEGSLGGAMNLISEGLIPRARELEMQIEQLFAGHAPADLAGWLKHAADQHAETELERDPLGSKESATRAGLNLYLSFAARWLRVRLRQTADADQLEQTCRAIDAMSRFQMYLDANVNVPLALGQLAAAWDAEFAAR